MSKKAIYLRKIQKHLFLHKKTLLQNGGLCIETTPPSAALTPPLTQGRHKEHLARDATTPTLRETQNKKAPLWGDAQHLRGHVNETIQKGPLV